MCGIAGKISYKNKVEEGLLERMIAVLRHRGPDDKGTYLDNSSAPFVGLAHARLSIIDLTTGHQPMANEDGTIWVVYNGEIYNFPELKDRLIAKGHIFKTHSDTEVIVHLYEDKGVDMLSDLRGMFAFAIWDGRRKRLFAARDRVGKKPFNFYYDGANFVFGSEIKAILEDNAIARSVDLSSMDFYLTYGYTPEEKSIFKDIKKLPPAHYLTLDENGLSVKRYWSLEPAIIPRMSIREYESRIEAMLEEATRIRLISDVPLGVFLSGGVDSSLVVAMMSKASGSRVKTFSIGFDYEDFSELKYAKEVAERFNTDHREFIVKPKMMDVLEKLVWHYNEPFGDSSCLPTYYVAKYTREHVKVVLNGDGGDESFGGYDRYKGARLSSYLDFLPRWVSRLGGGGIAFLDKLSEGKAKESLLRKRHFFDAMLTYKNLPTRYAYWMSYFTYDDKRSLFNDTLTPSLAKDNFFNFTAEKFKASPVSDVVNSAMQADIGSYLPGDLLVKMDIATMANSLEARAPFLDHKLMEFMASLPSDIKLRGMESKYIAKRIAAKYFSDSLVYRKKMGFGVPIGRWFKGEMKEYVRQILLDERATKRNYFKKEAVQKLIDDHQAGAADNKYKIWALLNLELWHRVFIDRR